MESERGLDPQAAFIVGLVGNLLAKRLMSMDTPEEVRSVTAKALVQAAAAWELVEASLGLASFTATELSLLPQEKNEGGVP